MKKSLNSNEETTAAKSDLQEPRMYQVVVHNDDYTPMEFVVSLLEKYFYMSRQRAVEVTLEAHIKGTAICGIFSKDFAESKVAQIVEYAATHEHPLNCSMETA